MKKLLTLDNLYDYFVAQNTNVNFCADNEKTQIIVQVPGTLLFKKNDKDTEGLLPVHLQANHTQTNINGSHIEDDVAEKALPSFSNRPILGYLHKLDGQWEFWGHNMHEDDEGNIEYDETAIGIIPESCGAKLVYDKEKEKTFVEIDGYIFEEYSHAAEVLKRTQESPVSVELAIRELAYNAKEKYLDIKDYYYSGVTILGKDDQGNDIKPGMTGSNIKLSDFSVENNSTINDINDINEKLDKLFDKISSFFSNTGETQEDSTKGGQSQVNKFEELLEKYNKTVDDIKFEYEGLTDEELEIAFAEAFGNENDSDDSTDSNISNEEENPEDETFENESNNDESDNDESDDNNEVNDDDNEESLVIEENESLEQNEEQHEEKFTKTFAISHEDIRCALYTLLASYEEADNDWYFIESVYDDHFTYSGMFTNNIFGQNYSKDEDEVSFKGERYELYRELLTASEKAELESMRANYSSIKEELAQYQKKEEFMKKTDLLNSKDYASISNDEEFIKLKESASNEEDIQTFEEVKEKADHILLSAVKNGTLSFSEKEERVTGRTNLPITNSKKFKNRYGDLFEGLL